MKNFNQGGRGRFAGGRNGGSRFGGGRPEGGRGPVTMHQAICSKCGRECEVPFRPTGDKPIYCNDCFGTERDRGSGRAGDRFPRKDFGSRSATRPALGGNRSDDNGEVKKQLEYLGLKIDRLTKVVEGLIEPKTNVHKETNIEVGEILQDLSVIKKTKTKAPAKKAVKKVAKKTKV